MTKNLENAQREAEAALWNIPAERKFVAAMMARPDWLAQAAVKVPAEWFFCFGAVYRKMLEMHYAAVTNNWGTITINLDSLIQFAQSQGKAAEFEADTSKYERVRAAQQLATSQEFNPEAESAMAFSHLRDAAARITLCRAALNVQIAALRGTDLAHIAAGAQQDIANVAAAATPGAGIQPVGSGMLTASTQGFKPSHLPQLARLLSGFQPGLHVIAARTNVGKSALLGSLALDAAVNQRVPVLYLDLEMGRDKLLKRAVSWQLQEDQDTLFRAYADDPAAKARADGAQAVIQAAPLFIANIATANLDQIVDHIRQFRRSYAGAGPGVVVLDYIRAVEAGRTPEWQVLDKMTAAIRELAVEQRLPAIAGIQTNRAALNMDQSAFASAGIGTIAGSDRVSHHADSVLLLRNLSESEQRRVLERFGPAEHDGKHELNRLHFNQIAHLTKNRDGATRESGIPLRYVRGQARYVELPTDDLSAIHEKRSKQAGTVPTMRPVVA